MGRHPRGASAHEGNGRLDAGNAGRATLNTSPERPPSTPAGETCGTLLRAAQLVRVLTADQLAEHGLNDARLTVLAMLERISKAAAECSQAELAAELLQSESNVCTLVERMRKDGLLYRMRSKHDRRKRLLKLTESGRQVLQQAGEAFEERAAVLLSRLDSGQRRALDGVLTALVSQLEELSKQSPAEAAPAEGAAARKAKTAGAPPRKAVAAPHFHSPRHAEVVKSRELMDETAWNGTSQPAGMQTDATTDPQ